MRTSRLSSAMSNLQTFLRDLRHEMGHLGDDSGQITKEEEEIGVMLDRAEAHLRSIIYDLDDFCDTFESELEQL